MNNKSRNKVTSLAIQFISTYGNEYTQKCGPDYVFCSGFDCSNCAINAECSEINKTVVPMITKSELNRIYEEYPEFAI